MSLSLAGQRAALQAQIKSALDASAQPANVYDYPPDSPQLNAVLIMPRQSEDGNYVGYHGTFNGSAGALCRVGWRVEIRCGGGQIDAAKAMDLYLSTGNAESVLDALLDDPTLGSAVQTIQIGGVSVPAWFTGADEARTWLSAFFDVDVSARR